MSNRDFYEDTELDGLVPFERLGRPLADDDQIDAIARATEAAGSKPETLVELGTPMTGELFQLDEALRESLEVEADHVAVPDGTAGIVRWSLTRNETESTTTMHWLDAAEYAEIDRRCMSRLLDRLTAAGDAASRETAATALIAEWERR